MSMFRNHTRAVAIVHSHNDSSGPIDISKDLFEIKISKETKGAGGASIQLVPRRNYFNIVFPNDTINMYIDPGDGERGFIRTFMGYIDRVERNEQVDEETGAMTTLFRLVCTDFTKAFDRTELYFNPHLANKDFVDNRFGMSLLGGHALRTRGITAHGTPADMIENISTLMLGFGAQWRLPRSYPTDPLQKNRQRRIQRAKSRIPKAIQSQAAEILGVDLDNFDLREDVINKIIRGGPESSTQNPQVDAITGAGDTAVGQRLEFLKEVFEGSTNFNALKTITRETEDDSPYTILDLLDLSFIEAMSVDGYIQSTGVWQGQGSLASIMYGYCNEIVNELMFDLRPVVNDNRGGISDSCFGSGNSSNLEYSRDPDELGINKGNPQEFGGFSSSVNAVKYVPAIVFREYPYSVVEGLDLSNVYILDGEASLQFQPFGPVFAQKKEGQSQYRAIYNYEKIPRISKKEIPSLAPTGCFFNKISKPLKHLDVVEIGNEDVIQSNLGRSDNDTFNLFALYATNPLIEIYKYILRDIFPIITPAQIARHGLRAMEVKTVFANFGRSNICEDEGSVVNRAAIRRNLVRWGLLLDHWNQHNIEYLSGTVQLRGRPEIRVGYRLDWRERNESYYVESVNHVWRYPGAMTTTLKLSRGQRNDPYPAYIPPSVNTEYGRKTETVGLGSAQLSIEFGGEFAKRGGGNRGGQEGPASRLDDFFSIKDTAATLRSTQRESSALDQIYAEFNIIDEKPNADRGGVAVYPGELNLDEEFSEPVDVEVSVAEEEEEKEIKNAEEMFGITWGNPGNAIVTSGWGDARQYRNGTHHGVDIATEIGDDVFAAADGEVVFTGFLTVEIEGGPDRKIKAVRIHHPASTGTVESRYLHLSEFLVSVGDTVSRGDVIAKAGATGIKNSAAHTHVDLLINSSLRQEFIDKNGGEPVPPIFEARGFSPKYMVPAEAVLPLSGYRSRVVARANKRNITLRKVV